MEKFDKNMAGIKVSKESRKIKKNIYKRINP